MLLSSYLWSGVLPSLCHTETLVFRKDDYNNRWPSLGLTLHGVEVIILLTDGGFVRPLCRVKCWD